MVGHRQGRGRRQSHVDDGGGGGGDGGGGPVAAGPEGKDVGCDVGVGDSLTAAVAGAAGALPGSEPRPASHTWKSIYVHM
jgi:hypothetical protein